MDLEKRNSATAPKNLDELFTALEKLMPRKTEVGARGAQYKGEAFLKLTKPTPDEIENTTYDIVFGLRGNEELTEDQVQQFVLNLDLQDRHGLNEVATTLIIVSVVRRGLEDAYTRSENLGEGHGEDRLALGDAESAVSKYADMFRILGAFLEMTAARTKNDQLKVGLTEYVDDVQRMPLEIRESFAQQEDED